MPTENTAPTLKTYTVEIREVHVSYRTVEATSPEAAMDLAGDAEDESTEYSHTLGRDTWVVWEKGHAPAG